MRFRIGVVAGEGEGWRGERRRASRARGVGFAWGLCRAWVFRVSRGRRRRVRVERCIVIGLVDGGCCVCRLREAEG